MLVQEGEEVFFGDADSPAKAMHMQLAPLDPAPNRFG
jgi:hypothetical protein